MVTRSSLPTTCKQKLPKLQVLTINQPGSQMHCSGAVINTNGLQGSQKADMPACSFPVSLKTYQNKMTKASKRNKWPNTVQYTYNPWILDAEAGGLIQAQDQPKLRSESEASLGFIITRLCQKRGRRKEERGEAGDRGRERDYENELVSLFSSHVSIVVIMESTSEVVSQSNTNS